MSTELFCLDAKREIKTKIRPVNKSKLCGFWFI